MKNKNQKYPLLKAEDFKKIAKDTGYSSSHVRQILRGYVEQNDRHASIIKEAEHNRYFIVILLVG